MNNPSNLGREGIIAGRQAQGRLKETPGALSIENSVTVNRPTHNLDSGSGSGRILTETKQQLFLNKIQANIKNGSNTPKLNC